MASNMTNNTRLRVAHLNANRATPFTLKPDADARAALANELDLSALPELSFSGEVRPSMNDSWELTGRLSARLTQPCIVTLAPVTTRVAEDVHRLFSPYATTPEGEEVEMPDEDIEPLGQFIDLAQVMTEALALAIPLYPRAEGAELDETPEADEPTETRRPFAGLADLMSKKTN